MANLTLLDLAKRSGNEPTVGVVESMSQSNALLALMPFISLGNKTNYKYMRRAGLPTVTMRGYNQGIDSSKSIIKPVVCETTIVEGRSIVDVLLANDYPDGANAYRSIEDAGFAAAMSNTFNGKLFYGSNKTSAVEFDGISTILSALVAGGNVLSAGGSTASGETSIYAISFGDANTVQGRRPGVKGLVTGSQVVDVEDLGKQLVPDADSKDYLAYVTNFVWRPGLAVHDTQSIGRIANIDATHKPTITLLNQLITGMHPFRPDVFLCSKTVFNYVQELKGTTWVSGFGDNAGDLFKRVLSFDGIPFFIDESITATEAVVS